MELSKDCNPLIPTKGHKRPFLFTDFPEVRLLGTQVCMVIDVVGGWGQRPFSPGEKSLDTPRRNHCTIFLPERKILIHELG